MRGPALFAAILLGAAVSAVHAQPGDWGVHRDPFDPNVVARYKAMLARDPHDASALANLLKLYRSFRTVDLLEQEYGKQVDKKADDWAALVVLGRLFHATGDEARALELWTRAVAVKDDDSPTWGLIGEADRGAGKNTEARAAYDKALAHATSKDTKKKALRALADLALATGDNDGANNYFKDFLALDPNNAQLWIERGDAMLAAGKRDIALDSYSAAEKLLGSDPSRRVEIVSRRGQALEAMGKDDEAVAEYRRAIKLAPKGYYLETELTGRIIDIYRRKQSLAQLLADYEKTWPERSRGYFEWDVLGKLYEETGAQDKAIAALKHAVSTSPTELDTQRRLIGLLENSGRDDEALVQYETVVRIAPGEARFQLELGERYWRRGEEKKALEVLSRLEARFPETTNVLAAIADLYTKWNKDDLALGLYERLAKLEPDDPAHLVTLGEQYWQKGDHVKANATWTRMTLTKKAIGFAKLGEVLGEHGETGESLQAYQRAIELDGKNPEFYKGRAAVYESSSRRGYEDARRDWAKVLELIGNKPTDRAARRDARKHYVALLLRLPGAASTQRDTWTKDFTDKSDVEAGYFLVELYAHGAQGQQKLGEPQHTLEKLVTLVPDDQDAIMDLVKVYRGGHQYKEAVALLLKLAALSPTRERDVYQTISEIMTEARQDEEAIKWQQKALDKNPSDPGAHERLGERYAEMQRFAEAITAYEQAVKLDAHNTKAAFALSELYIQNDQPMKAAELLRNVLRTATSEADVARAGKLAIDLEENTDTLGELEKVMSPLSFMMAHKPIYRHVLVELYARYVPVLVGRVHHGNDEVKKAARAELDRVGSHGLQPLLEALRDDKDKDQQKIAVDVLGHLHNKGAAEALVHMARQEPPKDNRHYGTLTDSPDREARIEALVGAGRLGDASVVADVLPLMDHQEAAMREAATFTLGRSGDRRAVAPLVHALGDAQPAVQTLACLGLAQIDDPRVAPALIEVVKDNAHGDRVRAACAFAIGNRKLTSAVPVLLEALADNRSETQRLAAWSLGQLGDAKALGPLIRAYFSRAGSAGEELEWAIGRASGIGTPSSPADALAEYPMHPSGYADDQALALLPGALPHPQLSAKLVSDHVADIGAGLTQALALHRDVVVSVLADLDSAHDHIALGALTPPDGDPKLASALSAIGDAIDTPVAAQLAADDPRVRALAISVYAKLDAGKPRTVAALQKALTDRDDQVRLAAIAAVEIVAKRRGATPTELAAALIATLQTGSWIDGSAAARTLGRLHAGQDALIKAAGDPKAFVRDAVAGALGDLGGAAAVATLQSLVKDGNAQVRASAEQSLGRLKP